jgi:hypothetical protein
MGKEPTHVVQAMAELANARAYGQRDRVRAAEKALAAAGRRTAAADDEDEARVRAPEGRTTAPRQVTADNAAVRAWAADAGLSVSGRGKIPDDVLAAYHQAHGGGTA